MIESLTDEQKAMLVTVRDEWIAIGLATGPGDRAVAEEGAKLAYKEAELEAPILFIWLDSPLQGVLAAAAQVSLRNDQSGLDKRWDELWDHFCTDLEKFRAGQPITGHELPADNPFSPSSIVALRETWVQALKEADAFVPKKLTKAKAISDAWNPIWDAQPEAQRDALHSIFQSHTLADVVCQVMAGDMEQYRSNAMDQVWSAVCGQHDAGPLAFYDAVGRLGVEAATRLKGLSMVAKNCGWWWPFQALAIMTERPVSLGRDRQGRLHAEDGPAVKYADDFALWAWHGVRVAQRIIEDPGSMTPEEIGNEHNAEVRRVMIERYGAEKYLGDTKTKLIDSDVSHGMPRMLVEDGHGDRFLYGSDNSTGRVYAMPVDDAAETCVAAHESICGFSESKLHHQS